MKNRSKEQIKELFYKSTPMDVVAIINHLIVKGYEAYLVGGCVRDVLMGIEPNDWDITTNATPQQVKEVFSGEQVIPTGEKHGTVTLMMNGVGYEITTYRIDGEYEDNRRPKNVVYTTSLEEDLARRDFTINAMAYNQFRGLVDLYGGLEDIKNEVVKCVGDPKERFEEDALRIMRMHRFSFRYGFRIDIDSLISGIILSKNLKNISKERISKELKGIMENYHTRKRFMSRSILVEIIPQLLECTLFDQSNPHHHYLLLDHILHACKRCDPQAKVETKIALLLHDIAKPHCFSKDENGIGHFYGHAEKSAEMAQEILTDLKFSNEEIKFITSLIRHHDRVVEPTKKSIRKALNVMGVEVFEEYLKVREADIKAQSTLYKQEKLNKLNDVISIYRDIKENQECFTLKGLAITGRDILENLGVKEGEEVGRLLKKALEYVIEDNTRNSKETLLLYLKEVVF